MCYRGYYKYYYFIDCKALCTKKKRLNTPKIKKISKY